MINLKYLFNNVSYLKTKHFLILFTLMINFVQSEIVRRGALDIGSGALKLLLADVDTETLQIKDYLYSHIVEFPFSESLAGNPKGSFFENELQDQALLTLKQMLMKISQHQPVTIVAIATEAFRQAKNGNQLALKLKNELGIPVHIISQKEEAEIAFKTALAISRSDPEHTVVWDIGAGSFQISWKNEQEIQCYSGQIGQVITRNILLKLQGKSIIDNIMPYPISLKEANSVRKILIETLPNIPQSLKNKLQAATTQVYGIGGAHRNNITASIGRSNYHLEDVEKLLADRIGLSIHDFENLVSDCWVTDLILVSSIMSHLNIKEVINIHALNHSNYYVGGNTAGILIHKSYWK